MLFSLVTFRTPCIKSHAQIISTEYAHVFNWYSSESKEHNIQIKQIYVHKENQLIVIIVENFRIFGFPFTYLKGRKFRTTEASLKSFHE